MNERIIPPNSNKPPKKDPNAIYRNGEQIGYSTSRPNADYASKEEVSKFWKVIIFIQRLITKN